MNIINRIGNKFIRVKMDIYSKFPFYYLIKSNTPLILMYHGIAPRSPIYLNERHIYPEVFEQHLKYLRSFCNLVKVEDIFNNKIDKNKKNVAITFDDGYWNNLEYALPILEKYKVPAHFFITGLNTTNQSILWSDYHDLIASSKVSEIKTNYGIFTRTNQKYMPFYSKSGENLHAYLKGLSFEEKYKILNSGVDQDILLDERMFPYWKLLTDREIIELSSSSFAFIGSHGFYHDNLGYLDRNNNYLELNRSKTYLENIVGKEIDTVAFPDGSYNKNTLEIAMELGYKYLLGVDPHKQDIDNYPLKKRIGLYMYETLSMQKVKMMK
ncbi:polysaccharide deacetylase family protein [Marivirga arenosa]|uniref:Polysaccharide deacetylase family protein n=1 Tax=Marivirga arenosa TaxID=3059076 RepID=A0AA51ZWQ6_9BACT|nr:polysaccharide deacetylase family protein [Marivirga sp. BKB1-2]WNB18071.1 polysaccharide deacetylase family protein [Marivirga sp. BKB1-2]